MENRMDGHEHKVETPDAEATRELLNMDPASIPSPVIARLIEEVRNEEQSMLHGYNRFHNRHNR